MSLEAHIFCESLIKKYFKGLIGIKIEVLEGLRLVKTQLALF